MLTLEDNPSIQSSSDMKSSITVLNNGNGHQQTVYMSKLKTRVQQIRESLEEFAAEVEIISQLNYASAPANIQLHLAIQTFIDGL